MKKIFLMLSIMALTSCEKREEIHIERIVFHTSRSFLGKDPSYHLAIDKNRIASLIVEEAFKNSTKFPTVDSAKIGYYIGQVDEKQFKALERELYRIDIINLQLEDLSISDVSEKSIIIYLQGKKIKIDKTYRSKKLNSLVTILESIYEDGSFTKVNQQFGIEE